MSLLTQVFVTETLILSLFNANEFLEGDIYNIIFFFGSTIYYAEHIGKL